MPWPASFILDHERRSVTISSPPASSNVSAAVAHVNDALQQAVDAAMQTGLFPSLKAGHSEPFRILGARHGLVHVERFAASLFGIATRGAHMTAYTRTGGRISGIWVARRSRSLYTYPGMLDSTVAGGVKATDTPTDCIRAEASEEAALPEDLVLSSCVPVGVITLANRNRRTDLFHSEVLYVYDLELPAEVAPTPADGEVEEFLLMSVDDVRRRMEQGEFKPNVCAVMIDFMIRHGAITPESEGEGNYGDLNTRLRRRLPVPLASDLEE